MNNSNAPKVLGGLPPKSSPNPQDKVPATLNPAELVANLQVDENAPAQAPVTAAPRVNKGVRTFVIGSGGRSFVYADGTRAPVAELAGVATILEADTSRFVELEQAAKSGAISEVM